MTPPVSTSTIETPARPSQRAATRIVPQTEAEAAAVRAFNERMTAGHAPTDFVLPESPNDPRLADDGRPIAWKKYVVLDQHDDVHGGFLVMQQRGWLNGAAVTTANYQSPVSEGILDKRYGLIGVLMVQHVVRQWPYAFAVGMGSMDRPAPRLLAAAGWTLRPVPFLFRIVRAARVLRELRPLRGRPAIAAVATLAAATGAGAAGAGLLHVRGAIAPGPALTVSRAPAWGPWADILWNDTRDLYSFCVARDRETLDCLYPVDDDRYRLYTFAAQDGAIVGWAVCAVTAMRNDDYFGNLTVATVLDAVARPEMAPAVASALSRTLSSAADLIITNQSHGLWVGAFRRAGFASAPSNYLLATSKPLTTATGGATSRLHVTRGDGDGRIHLI